MTRGKSTREARERRHHRVRGKVQGTGERPRLNVFRSLSHIYAQVIDDAQGRTLVAASSLEAEIKSAANGKKKLGAAELVGAAIGRRARDNGITKVVFDRGGYLYHGRVKALAEAARGAGLDF